MDELIKQIKEIDPSAKDALFRRLLYDKSLAFLRPDRGSIIGFDLDLTASQMLSGFTVIAIQKHTILAMKSDLDEQPRLILFPAVDKIRDDSFGLRDLIVSRVVFTSDDFAGLTTDHGRLGDLAADLLPPHKNVNVDDKVASGFALSDDEANTANDIQDDIPDDIPDDVPDNKPIYTEQTADQPIPDDAETTLVSDPRSDQLLDRKAQFKKMTDLIYYVVTTYHVDADIANNVANVATQKGSDEQMQIDIAVLLFVKLFNAHKIGNESEAF